MTEISRDGWLYTRGSQSIRLVREQHSKGCLLSLHGPGTELVTHELTDVTECMKRQAEIERRLLAARYRLAQPSSNRRSEEGLWCGPDQRRAATLMTSRSEEQPMTRDTLFWSRRGGVACGLHAPASDFEQWQSEGWCSIPDASIRRHGLAYQCPHCAPDGRVHRPLQP